MQLRERLSPEQLELKKTYEPIDHFTATIRLLLLLLLLLLLVCSCWFSCRVPAVFYLNIFGVFNFSLHYLSAECFRFLAFRLCIQKRGTAAVNLLVLWLVEKSEFVIAWDEYRTPI